MSVQSAPQIQLQSNNLSVRIDRTISVDFQSLENSVSKFSLSLFDGRILNSSGTLNSINSYYLKADFFVYFIQTVTVDASLNPSATFNVDLFVPSINNVSASNWKIRYLLVSYERPLTIIDNILQDMEINSSTTFNNSRIVVSPGLSNGVNINYTHYMVNSDFFDIFLPDILITPSSRNIRFTIIPQQTTNNSITEDIKFKIICCGKQ